MPYFQDVVLTKFKNQLVDNFWFWAKSNGLATRICVWERLCLSENNLLGTLVNQINAKDGANHTGLY